MLNLRRESARRVEVSIDGDVSAGALVRRSDVLGIPVANVLSGNTVTFIQEGLVTLTFSGQGTIGAGSYLYWDVSAAALSLGAAAADLPVGQVIAADPDGGANVYLVRMNIGYPRAAAGNDQSTIAE